ncbi:related to NAD-dependent protein deacylase [Zygosaccharomyces bailii]|nr:related to NAD-dependent protein deacylase [Zygosaccharomyces bailii]
MSNESSDEETVEDPQLRSFHSYLRQARKILCVVGSGLSQSSGIPTYQLQRGTWKGYTSLDLATPEAFQSNPGLVWLFYSNRRYIAMKAKPNDGHFALARLAKNMKERHREVFVVTQNVDGLHQRTGQAEEDLCELHGSLFQLRCTSFFCTYKGKNTKDLFLTSALREFTPRDVGVKRKLRHQLPSLTKRRKKQDITKKEEDGEESLSSSDFEPLPELKEDSLPHCPKCGEGLLRPGVVWFGEPLPLMEMVKVDKFFAPEEENANDHIDLVLVIGTSGKVWPAMGYVERCKQNGGRVAIFNTHIEDKEKVRKDKTLWGFEGEAAVWLPRALEPLIGKHFRPS